MKVRLVVAWRVALLGSLIVGFAAGAQTGPSQQQQAQQAEADCEALQSALARAAAHAKANQAMLCSLTPGGSPACREAAAAAVRAQSEADQQAEDCRRQRLAARQVDQQHQAPAPGGPGQRPPQWGRPPASRPTYAFRPADRNRLRGYYATRLREINQVGRPLFRMGMYFPLAYIPDLSPVPPSMRGLLPPVPPGYGVGYYDGYVVVYDPVTYWIAGVVDLL